MKLNNFKKQLVIINNLLVNIWKQLTLKRKYQFLIVIFVTILNSLAEILSLSIIVPFLGILVNREEVYNTKFIQYFANLFSISNPEKMTDILLVIFVITIFISTSIKLLNVYVNGRYSAIIGVDLSSKAFNRVLSQRYLFHINNNSSKLISTMTTKVELAIEVIGDILQILTSIVVATGLILTLIIIEPKFTILTGGSIITIYFVILYLISKRQLNINSKIISRALNNQIKLLQEGFGSIIDVILKNNQKEITNIHYSNEYKLRNYKADSIFLTRFPKYLIEGFLTIFIGIYGYFLIEKNIPSIYVISLLGGLVVAIQKILPNIQLIYYSYSTIMGYFNSVYDLIELINLDLPIETKYSKKDALIIQDKIELKNVTFRYESEDNNILEKINLEIKKGEKIGLIGETGQGKSTMIKIIMGLLFPNDGKFLVDGKDLYNYDFPNYFLSWRSSISYVPQSIYLTDSTIAENIALLNKNDNIDYQRVKESAKIAQIEDFIKSQRNSYYELVGERGTKLSGGQLQRIGIARALYSNDSNILVLDEATSSLDPATAEKIINSINLNYKEKIILMVSHKLESLKFCDKIIKLKNGSIVIYPKGINSID